jgi:phage gpG-like protein
VPFSVDFKAFGEDDVAYKMLGMGDRLDDASPVLHAIADMLRLSELKLFETEDAWAPLKESTIERKRALGQPLDILKATEAMFRSLTRHGSGGFEVITDDTLYFGTSVEYAKFHKTGTRFMPKRDPLLVDESLRRRITKEVQRYMVAQERAMFGVPEFGGIA